MGLLYPRGKVTYYVSPYAASEQRRTEVLKSIEKEPVRKGFDYKRSPKEFLDNYVRVHLTLVSTGTDLWQNTTGKYLHVLHYTHTLDGLNGLNNGDYSYSYLYISPLGHYLSALRVTFHNENAHASEDVSQAGIIISPGSFLKMYMYEGFNLSSDGQADVLMVKLDI